MPFHLLFPLFSSLVFVGAMLFIKRATDFRIGVWRVTFVANVITALLFLALLPLGGGPITLSSLWQPLVTAMLFIGGQAFTFLALEKGDVSIATPTMGVKTICVAWLSVLILGVEIPWQLWLSALMTFAAIGFLNVTKQGEIPRSSDLEWVVERGKRAKDVGKTIVLALLAALCYALFDVLVQLFSPRWGVGSFLPIMLGLCAGLSFGFVPLFKEPISRIPREAWPWLGGGTLLMGLQAISLVYSVAQYGDATAINIVYSARGLWSVVAVWLIGHWFRNQERALGRTTFRFRLLGAVMMTAAIAVTFMR